MHNRALWMTLGLASALALSSVQAETYRCVDAEGRLSYTNVPGTAGCKPAEVPPDVSIPPPTIPPATRRAPEQPQNNAGSDAQSQIASEQAALERAKKELEEQQAIRLGNEHNYQKKLDRLKPYEDAVREHEEKIKTLQQ